MGLRELSISIYNLKKRKNGFTQGLKVQGVRVWVLGLGVGDRALSLGFGKGFRRLVEGLRG